MIKLPERYNYVEIYLTFRCNLNCDYCINRYDNLEKRVELSGVQWINSLNNIDFGEIPLTLGGGEPTIHKDFYKILAKIKKDIKVDLLTNLQTSIEEFIKKVSPDRFTTNPTLFYHPIRASYHAEKMDRADLIERAKQLRDNNFNVGIFGINHPHYINENMAMGFFCSKAGVPFYLKDFLGSMDGGIFGFYKYPDALKGVKKQVNCRTRELLVAPDGNIFRCHRDLYNNQNPIGNILDKNSEIKDIFRPCENYGSCNPCDVKAKTNRYLKGVDCQVEIKEINHTP